MLEKESQLPEILGDKFQELAKAMPDAFSFLQGIELEPHTQVNFNIGTKTLTFLTKRSELEWVGGGGMTGVSRVGVWQDGQVQEREFKYTGTWHGDRNDFSNAFKSADIESVIDDEDVVIVRVSAQPLKEYYHPRQIEFKFSKVPQTGIIPDFSEEKQSRFEAFFRSEMARIIGEKQQAREFIPKKAFISSSPVPSHPTEVMIPYIEPAIVSEVMDKRICLGAFITKEQIDNYNAFFYPEIRYELYVTEYGEQEVRRIIKDNVYLVVEEGDPSIMDLEITGSKIAFTTKGARWEWEQDRRIKRYKNPLGS